MPLAFAVANSCGEAGRCFFHRLCRLSEKYRQDEAEKLYDHALQHARGGNSLGTVFHLAQQAGVRLDKKLANLQNLQSPHTHTRVCARKEIGGNTPKTPSGPADGPTPPPPPPTAAIPLHLPCFPDYQWPRFLQQIIDCGNTSAQRDILLPDACLAEPIHNSLPEACCDKLKAYRREKAQWDSMLKRMTDKGQLKKGDRGEYSFN